MERVRLCTHKLNHTGMICSNNTMTTYVLLLRGVTPSGRNKVPMAQFRETLEKAAFAHVRTYIQSGNALVDTELPPHTVEKNVRELIRNQIGPDLVVIARTGAQLEEALEANPFTKGYDISRVFFVSFEKHLRHRRLWIFCLWISPRKNLPLVKILRICTFQVRMAGGQSLVIFWKRNSGSQPRCGISIP